VLGDPLAEACLLSKFGAEIIDIHGQTNMQAAPRVSPLRLGAKLVSIRLQARKGPWQCRWLCADFRLRVRFLPPFNQRCRSVNQLNQFKIFDELGVCELHWVLGIHFNREHGFEKN
jgi:hypothetical protein